MAGFRSSPETMEAAVKAGCKGRNDAEERNFKESIRQDEPKFEEPTRATVQAAAPVLTAEAYEAGRQAERERLREVFASEAEKARAVMNNPEDEVVRGIIQGTAAGLEAAVNLAASPTKGGESDAAE